MMSSDEMAELSWRVLAVQDEDRVPRTTERPDDRTRIAMRNT